MANIKKSVEIDAPVEEVFDYLTNPENLPEVWPSMVEVTNIARAADGRHSFDWTYKMAGLKFHGHADTVEAETHRRVRMRNESGIPSTFEWTYEERGDKTRLTVEIDYEIPNKLLEKLAHGFVHRQNEREVDAIFANLKERLEYEEGRPTAPGEGAETRP